jgi:hypothetical protein
VTAYNLSFTVSNIDESCHLFSVRQPITSALASDIDFVKFANGVGQIFYNDRQPLPELFSDPSPYQTYINQWITAAAAATLPLTLAQAKAIKCALVQAIYGVKIEQPVSVAVTGGTFSFSPTDPTLVQLSSLAYIADLNTVVSEVNTVNSGWATSFGNWVSTFQTNINTWVSALQSNLNSWMGNLASSITVVEPTWVSPGNPSVPSAPTVPSSPSFGTVSPITPPAFQLVPVGATAAQTISSTDLKNILAAIAAQSINEDVVNATKQAAVNALSTIAAVASYDATTGW